MAVKVSFSIVEGKSVTCAYKNCDNEPDVFVAHTGEGMKHPFHRHCAVDGASDKETCPYSECGRAVDIGSLFSDKVLSEEEKSPVKEMPKTENLNSMVKELREELSKAKKELTETHNRNAKLLIAAYKLNDQIKSLEKQVQDDAEEKACLSQRITDAELNLSQALSSQTPPSVTSIATQTVAISNQGNPSTAVYSSMITAAVLITAYVIGQFLF